MTNVDVKVSMPIFPNDQCTISIFQQLYHLNSCLTDLLLCLSKKGIKRDLFQITIFLLFTQKIKSFRNLINNSYKKERLF